MISLIYCTHCGAQNKPNANFCIACGKPISKTIDQQSSKLSKEAKIFLITLVSLAIVIAVIYSFFFVYEEIKPNIVNQGDKPDTEIISDEKQDINSMPSKQNYAHIKETRFKDDCYVVITASFESEENAKENVQKLLDRGYSNSGYFWRPDYYSTSRKAFYVSFIGPYNTYEECRYAYNQNKQIFKGSYGINISQSANEEKIRD
jgi:hypothetical protein